MIYWAPFLHFYQPPIQFHAILKKICNESYRPLLKMLLEHSGAKVTVNICGVLTELLNDHGAQDVLENIKLLARNKQVEFVDSAKYHAVLPLIPQKEMQRQIKLNSQTNKYFFKDLYQPRGVFPPEMCYSNEVAKVVKTMGYDWILISGVASHNKWPMDFISSVSYDSSTIKVFYRDDILSNKISFQNIDSVGFIKELIGLSKDFKDIYVITAMDAETFGHHIHNWEKSFLEEVYEAINNIEELSSNYDLEQKKSVSATHMEIFTGLKKIPHIEVVTISELIEKFPTKKTKMPKPSSWSTTKEDIARRNYYPLWKDIGNKIHSLQWEHLEVCFELINQALNIKGSNKESNQYAIFARSFLDRAIHSCQFWWANKSRRMWNVNLINKGLMLQEEAVFNAYKAISISSATSDVKKDFYHKVVASRDIANKIRDLLILQ